MKDIANSFFHFRRTGSISTGQDSGTEHLQGSYSVEEAADPQFTGKMGT